MPVWDPKANELLSQALDCASAGQRDLLLDQACGADTELRARVEKMLAAHAEARSFLESPALDFSGSSDPFPIAERPGTIIGPYKLLQQIGEGGMGVVFMAEQSELLQRTVALKIIKLGMDTRQVIARFEAERQALALMDHPHIAKVLDAGTTENGRPYFVMELVRGVPITEFCDQQRLGPQQRLELFVQICRAIQHAHQKGIIHRDIKPTNILVALQDDRALPKVIDFGIAKATGERLTDQTVYTAFNQLIGTPLYMSPEQAEMNSLDIDTRSDVYSLGVLLYELLTGSTPFDNETLRQAGFEEMRRLIREVDPPRPSQRVSTLSAQAVSTILQSRSVDERRLHRALRGNLDWIVMKSLEKDRNRRYESASAFAVDVQRYLDNEPIEAKQPRLFANARKWSRRHPTLLWSAAVAVLIATVASVASSILLAEAYSTESSARHSAELERAKADFERRRADHALGRMQLQSGISLLNQGSELGLLDLLDASLTSKDDLNQQETTRRFWAIGDNVDRHTLVQVLTGCERGLAYSPDGKLLATANHQGVHLWDASTGKPHGSPLKPDMDVHSLQFSPNGQRLAAHSIQNGARLWDTRSGAPLASVQQHEASKNEVEGRPVFPWGASFSPDGELLATVGMDGTARLWHARTGESHGEPFHWRDSALITVAFSPDGKLLAAGSMDGTAMMWDITTRQRHGSPFRTEGYRVDKVMFSPDGKLLAVMGVQGTAWLLDAQTGEQKLSLVGGWMLDLVFSPDGNLLATALADWSVQLWDTATGQKHGDPLLHDGRVRVVAFSPDGKLLASGSVDRTLRLWDASTGKPYGQPLHHPTQVDRVTFSPDGRSVAGGLSDTRVWEINNQSTPRQQLSRDSRIGVSADSLNGRYRATINEKQEVELKDTSTGKAIEIPSRYGRVKDIAFSFDSTHLATGHDAWTAKLWELTTGREVQSFACDERVCGVAFNPAGNLLATALDNGNVILWDVGTGRTHGLPMKHSAPVQEVAFSPNGSLLVTASSAYDTTSEVTLWDITTDPPYLGVRLPLRFPA